MLREAFVFLVSLRINLKCAFYFWVWPLSVNGLIKENKKTKLMTLPILCECDSEIGEQIWNIKVGVCRQK